jgi:hypothetical protein
MRSNTFRPALLCLTLSTLFTFSNAEVRSGFWTLIQPSSDTGAFSVDFSSLTPFCASMGVNNSGCIITERDCYFKFDSIIAPYGVFYDSSVSATRSLR